MTAAVVSDVKNSELSFNQTNDSLQCAEALLKAVLSSDEPRPASSKSDEILVEFGIAAHENNIPLSEIMLSPDQIFLSTQNRDWLDVLKQPEPNKYPKIGRRGQLGEFDQRIFLPEKGADSPRFYSLEKDGELLRLTKEGVRFLSKCADNAGLL